MRVRVVAFQDWSLPLEIPDDGPSGDGDDNAGDRDGAGHDGSSSHQDASPGEDLYTGRRTSSDSGDSDYNRYHPGMDYRRATGMMGDDAVLGVTGVGDDAAVVGALIVGTVACPIRRPTQSATIGSGALTSPHACPEMAPVASGLVSQEGALHGSLLPSIKLAGLACQIRSPVEYPLGDTDPMLLRAPAATLRDPGAVKSGLLLSNHD